MRVLVIVGKKLYLEGELQLVSQDNEQSIDTFGLASPEVDQEPPLYTEPGRILFHLDHASQDSPWPVEVLDSDGSAFWIIEGGFPEAWVFENTELELDGHYVLEGITGRSWRDWQGEYDEEWEWKICRRASAQEIATGALDQ